MRYHRDTEKIESDTEKPFIIPPTSNNAKNVQLALLYQQRKKKENTKAQLIVDKIDIITDYYSDNIKNNPTALTEIKKYFQGPLSHRKTVLHNYLEEVKVLNKIRNLGRKAMEGNEYYLELKHAITHAYFNFKDFKKYGTTVALTTKTPINMIRYNNIEFQKQLPKLEIETHTGIDDTVINLVGLAIGPLNGLPLLCIRKEKMIDIRELKFTYIKKGDKITYKSENGYEIFYKFVKEFYVNTITIVTEPYFYIRHDYSELQKLNSDIFDKIIYWIYDVDKDEYQMETYETLKANNFQEQIRFMNAVLYDKIINSLNKRLIKLINIHQNLPISKIELLIELYSRLTKLFLKQDTKRELFIMDFLRKKKMEKSKIVEVSDSERIVMPEFIPEPDKSIFKIKIDTINPLHPQEYQELMIYGKEAPGQGAKGMEKKCQHENAWNEMIKLKSVNLNKYNTEITQFIEKFAQETSEMDYICRVCGQILPIKQYIQDGSFDNESQKFVAAYTPLDIPLDEIKEYAKYKLIIKYLDIALINRVSLITGTNMLIGNDTQIRQKRKALVKNIIDIIIKHNYVNMRNTQKEEDRLEFFSKKFNIDKDLDNVYFFELDDTIMNFSPTATETDVTLDKLKYNNILLYFILIFITELNGAQIAMMHSDKIANIYTYLKYGPKLFGNILIKKNINDMETVPIVRYPVLCYLIFLLGYFLTKYKLWYSMSSSAKIFDPVNLKVIIYSIADLFNGISINAGKMSNDYIYMLTASKLYSQLNSTFKNNDIIELLKKNHNRFSEESKEGITLTPQEKAPIKTYYIGEPIKFETKTSKIPSFKISDGIQLDKRENISFHTTKEITNITNCPQGSYHDWKTKGKDMVCTICNEKMEDANGQVIRFQDAYYFNMNKIANRRCLQGSIHDFVGQGGQLVCSVCGRKKGDQYTHKELDELANNLNKIEEENIQKLLKNITEKKKIDQKQEEEREKIIKELIKNYRKESSEKMYGQIINLTDTLIEKLESLLGADTKIDIDKFPVYLRDNVYIIDHSYNGTPIKEPIYLTERENRVIFKENHPFFKVDVYYYTDNRVQVDVFYNAVTLKLLGYKQKQKEYIEIKKINAYLKIISSIKNRLLTIGYDTKYINIERIFNQNKKLVKNDDQNFFQIMDNLIRDHILKIKSIIDKFCTIFYKIKNYVPPLEKDPTTVILQSARIVDNLITKYAKNLKALNFEEIEIAFDDWNELRGSFSYEQINWTETNIRYSGSHYINSELVNYYDVSSNLMIYYLVTTLIKIIDKCPDKISKTNLSQLYVEIITYIYDLYNMDKYKNLLDYKRFNCILNGSEYMVDLLKKGQGLTQSKELEEHMDNIQADISELSDLTEEQQDEIEDLKEEAQSVDIETDYFQEEDEDYGDRETFGD